ncbi:MAG: RNA 2',3'-cyclic phosphodiesterase [Brevinematia bacterium]
MDRLFIGIEIPEEVKRKFNFLLEKLDAFRSKVVPYENIHLTIKFIGETDKTNLILNTLSSIRFKSFSISIYSVGVFPNVYYPKVFWVGVKESKNLLDLFNLIDNKLLLDVGIPKDEREFSPHITLSRFKKPVNDLKKFIEFVEEYKSESFGEFEVKEFVLFKSILKQPDPVYSVLEKFNLIAK